MFVPKRIIFEKNILDYEIGENIFNQFKDNKNIEIIKLNTNKIKGQIPGEDLPAFYTEGKNTLVVGIKKPSKFQSCKPSAHWQLPLVSGCIGKCQYCYLNTNLSDKPYTKVYVNVDEILAKAESYIKESIPTKTIFEGSATSDPIPVEPYTHSLQRAIEYFAKSEYGRFRFVTKFYDVDTLLNLSHNNHTDIRFTLNTPYVINEFENRTSPIEKRIEAAAKVAKAGYRIGFIIAPVFLYEGWKKDYHDLLLSLREKLPTKMDKALTFEVISHRYTTRAKSVILEVFPDTTLPMKDEDRKYKYGQFGYGKFVYTKEQLSEIKDFFTREIENVFDNKIIKYII